MRMRLSGYIQRNKRHDWLVFGGVDEVTNKIIELILNG